VSSDIITRLDEAHESLSDIGGAWERDVVADAKAEIARLQRWKAEATEVLARWNAVADLVPAQLGQRLSDAVANEITQLRGHSQTLNKVAWMLHDAMGLIPDGATEYWGDINADIDFICALIREARRG
jgi:hypothetical protein